MTVPTFPKNFKIVSDVLHHLLLASDLPDGETFVKTGRTGYEPAAHTRKNTRKNIDRRSLSHDGR
jgi:hypothetical protein